MTREEHQELENTALAAMVGLLSGNPDVCPVALAKGSFDIAEAFQKERQARIGDIPPYDV
ncbi:hypothetical protein HU742_018240 [Pseudomonas sp. SWRI102]|uniref:Uncharacterized protein n=1 Tax=Pseudomonas marvdashtae TaxID=2745500 RepID=A0A923FP26_9PSED|nr:hypothetical protein [Pseudomonas marvdashtae]MBV4553088.1 hypothetical protein [Pseudomonas marvdashtae]